MPRLAALDPRQEAVDQMLALPVGDMFMLEYPYDLGATWAIYVKLDAEHIRAVASEGNAPAVRPCRQVVRILPVVYWGKTLKFHALRRQPSMDELIVLYHTGTIRSLKA